MTSADSPQPDPNAPLAGSAASGSDDRPRNDLRDSFAPSSTPAPPPRPTELSPRDRFTQAVSGKQAAAGQDAEDSDEEITLWEGNYSPRAMLGTAIGLSALSIGIITLMILYRMPSISIGLGIIAVLWLILAAFYAVRRWGIHYELTTQRFIHQTGLISRRTDRIEVIDIDDVTTKQGPVERILGIGTIEITSSDRSHPHIQMPGIPEVRKVASMIDEVRRKERKRRSLHIQTM